MTPDATSHSATEPAVQCSMFQATTGPLVSMALLSLDLDEVARRLSLTIEQSWDGHGAVRAAFFTLAGTDFVVTHHEGDPPGTYVWVRNSGPVDPAARTGILLTALGVGTEVVSYSTWGIGTDLSRIPAAWRRFRHRPVDSHQRFWESFRDRMGMYVGRVTYEGVTAYLDGYDHASGGALLNGLREWLAATYGVGENLMWAAQVVQVVFPEGRPDSPWSKDEHTRAVEGLVALLEEFFHHLQDPADAPPRTS
ncbi:hypothetical protein OG864_07745 [Streptomyces sp. NBC_00124]|uniref:hypothetical protein n=1 Tax=Streptomyces sp. NBC_00124 TaxID=2975662 RepID=UPI00225639DA|nr:hypothetical protein [Streptomyces sp. NBC_00124]MCX5358587.1 hypothetical protein [Streptomyces sp. NBC_00124]